MTCRDYVDLAMSSRVDELSETGEHPRHGKLEPVEYYVAGAAAEGATRKRVYRYVADFVKDKQ